MASTFQENRIVRIVVELYRLGYPSIHYNKQVAVYLFRFRPTPQVFQEKTCIASQTRV